MACSSGVLPQSVDGACVGEYNDILDVGPADNVEECMKFCLETDSCEAYTWWDNTSSFINTCFLYRGCKTQGECEGCTSGRINCIFTGPNQCVEYMVLDDPDRSVSYGKNQYCDNFDGYYPSYDWQGPGYYRIMSTAGNSLPEFSPGYERCGGYASGWLRGEHPEEIYAEVNRTVCFHSSTNDDSCRYQASVTVTNCDGYFVYWFPDTITCYLRYCATID